MAPSSYANLPHRQDAADSKTAATLASLDLSSFDLDGDGQIDWQVLT